MINILKMELLERQALVMDKVLKKVLTALLNLVVYLFTLFAIVVSAICWAVDEVPRALVNFVKKLWKQ